MPSISARTATGAVLEKIDELLVAGINQDQIAMVETDTVPSTNQGKECIEALRKIAACLKENAKKIGEARKLILNLQKDEEGSSL